MNRKMTTGAILGAALLSAAAGRAANQDPRVDFVQDLTTTASQDPKMGKDLDGYMKKNSLTAEKLVAKKLGRPTPANIQQYPGASKEGETHSLYTSDMEVRRTLNNAGAMVEGARKSAKDAPKKYVAEQGGKVVTVLGDTYNEVALETLMRINSVRAKLSEMVALAVVVNGGGGAGSAATAQSAQRGQDAIRARGRTVIIPGDAAIGQGIMDLVRPEIPLGRYGRALWEAARKETAELPEFIAARTAKLDEAQKMAKELEAKEGSYRKGMKGTGNGGTGQVLEAAVSSLGGHFMAINQSVGELNAFINGPGKAILDVLRCSEVTYEAGLAQTVEESEASRLAKANIAYDANVLAARGIGPMVDQWGGMISRLGNLASGEHINPPGYTSQSAVRAGQSRSGKDVSGKAHATADTLQQQ